MDIFQRIQLVMEFFQIGTLASGQDILHQRQIFDGVFQCGQISGIGILIHHTGHNTFKVIHGTQNILDLFSQEQVSEQFFHAVQTFIDLLFG